MIFKEIIKDFLLLKVFIKTKLNRFEGVGRLFFLLKINLDKKVQILNHKPGSSLVFVKYLRTL